MALKQDGRLLNLKGPLADKGLVLLSFAGSEALSRLFHFELEMISDEGDIKAKDVVGKNVTFSIKLADESPRFFNGFVSRFFAGDEDEGGRRNYRAEVVPNLWFLTRNSDCRIFENKNLKQITEEVLGERGLTDFKIDFKGEHAKREYCVQYRETDFNFLSRLWEEEGAWYTFQHDDGKHTLLIADKKSAYFKCDQDEVDYPTDFSSIAVEDYVCSWEHRYEFRSGKVAQADYNFVTPSRDIATDSKTVVDLPGADKYELFDYPGFYFDKGDGKPLADVRMEEEEVEHDVVHGKSYCRCFSPGAKFKIRQHRSASEKGNSFAITSVEHRGEEPESYETGGVAPDHPYSNVFTCIPDRVEFRPQRKTPKPSVQGVQTAVVIGDDDIPVDKYGRIRVRFPWDRKGKRENTGSCWIRVSQNWGGSEWGGMFLPHKGQEMIVDFVDGDPDRPLVIGRVYNEEQKIPLELPANKTKSAIRDHGGNEIVMEGASGGQNMRLFSPTHNTTMVLGNSLDVSTESFAKWLVGADWIEDVEGDKTDTIQGNKNEEVFGNQDLMVHGGDQAFIAGSKSETVLSGVSEMFLAGKVEKILGSENKIVAPNMNEVVGGVGTKIHYGVEITRSPKHVELSAAIKKEQAATARRQASLEMAVYKTQNQKIDNAVWSLVDLKQKVATLAQNLGKLEQKVSSVSIDCSSSYTVKSSSVEVIGPFGVSKKVEFESTLTVKGSVKLG